MRFGWWWASRRFVGVARVFERARGGTGHTAPRRLTRPPPRQSFLPSAIRFTNPKDRSHTVYTHIVLNCGPWAIDDHVAPIPPKMASEPKSTGLATIETKRIDPCRRKPVPQRQSTQFNGPAGGESPSQTQKVTEPELTPGSSRRNQSLHQGTLTNETHNLDGPNHVDDRESLRHENTRSLLVEHDVHNHSSSAQNQAKTLKTESTVTKVKMDPSWKHRYLRRRILVLFFILLCSCVVLLEVLFQLSESRHGLLPADAKRRYLWTYGPTTILTLIAAYWSRLEFQAKQSSPWNSMHKRPTESSRGILVDYISPFQPTTLVSSLWKRDFVVSISVLCTLLFKLSITFSTGLLSLSLVQTSAGAIPIQLLTSIQGNATNIQNIGSLPFDVMNAIIFSSFPYPEGTNGELAFQTFNSSAVAIDASIRATVDAISTDLDCDVADLHVEEWGIEYIYVWSQLDKSQLSQSLEVVSQDCQMVNMSILEPDLDDVYNGTFSWAQVSEGQCDNLAGDSGRRIILTAGEAAVGSSHNGSVNFTEPLDPEDPTIIEYYHNTIRNRTVLRSAQLLCKPILAQQRLQVVLNSSTSVDLRFQVESISSNSTTNSSISSISPWDFPLAGLVPGFANNSTLVSFLNFTARVDGAIILGILMDNSSTNDTGLLIQSDMLERTYKRWFQAINAQIARQALFVQGISNTTGLAVVNQDRLFVRVVALRGMESSLAIISVLIIAMIFLTPGSAGSNRVPSTVASLAVVLRNSKKFRLKLLGTGASSIASMKENWREISCVTSLTEHFEIQPIERIRESSKGTSNTTPSSGVPSKHHKEKFWNPYPGMVSRVLVFTSILFLIIALEVLLRFSQRNRGLGNVKGDTLHYVWTLIPATITVSIGIFFGSIDFCVRSLAPFVDLAQPSGSVFHRSLATNFLDMTTPTALLKASRLKYWTVLLATIATIIGSFLTIVAAGLFSAVHVPENLDVQLQQQTSFTSDLDPYSAEAQYSIFTAGLVLLANMSYPKWTFEDLVFPRLDFKEQDTTTNATLSPQNSTGSVQSTVPALRSRLACEWGANLSATLVDGGQLFPDAVVMGYANRTYLSISSETDLCMNGTLVHIQNNTYFGFVTGSDYYDDFYSQPGTSTESTCFNRTWIWGMTSAAHLQHLAVLKCNETAEEVAVDSRFLLPGFDIDSGDPPIPIEASARSSPVSMGFLEWNYLPTGSHTDSIDQFFQVALYGNDGVLLQSLGHPGDDEAVSQRLQNVYKLIRAQQFNYWNRESANASTAGPPIEATIENPTQVRLVQDVASTHTLVVLLAVLVVLGVMITLLMDTRHLLPKNPCSIAAMASLLADSNLLEKLPEDVGTMSGLEGGNYENVANIRFGLGWFNDDGERVEMAKTGDWHDKTPLKFGICELKLGTTSHRDQQPRLSPEETNDERDEDLIGIDNEVRD